MRGAASGGCIFFFTPDWIWVVAKRVELNIL